MVFQLGLIFALTLAGCAAGEGYPDAVHPNEQLPYNQGYDYEEPRSRPLANEIPGVAGKDYPIFREIPQTRFECEWQQYPGYYADPEAECQVYHICQHGGHKDSFLCPNGTLFNQERLVCAWWYSVDCSRSQSFYSINEAVAKAMEEADRRSQLTAEEELSRGYQRESNVATGYWNQDMKHEGWNKNDTPLGYNQKTDSPRITKNLSYNVPATSAGSIHGGSEFAVKPLPSANYDNSYLPEQNYKITVAEFANKMTQRSDFAEPANVYLPA